MTKIDSSFLAFLLFCAAIFVIGAGMQYFGYYTP